MNKMVVMAINSKNFYKSSSPNKKAYDFEAWHEASGNRALQSLIFIAWYRSKSFEYFLDILLFTNSKDMSV